MRFLTHLLTLLIVAVLTACGGGGGEPGTPNGSTGAGTGTDALFTTAPSSITLSAGTTTIPAYGIGGGIAPYSASSDHPSLVTPSVSGSNLTITTAAGVSGSAAIVVKDSKGTSVSITVTVATGPTLFTNAPSSFSLSIGAANFITVSGGVPLSGAASYFVNNSSPQVVDTTVTGSTLVVRGLSSGTASIAVSDAKGSVVVLTVTVPVVSALYSDAPSALTLASGTGNVFTVYGGTPFVGQSYKYRVNNPNPAVANAVITNSSLTVNGVSAGTTQLIISDSNGGTMAITVTVPAPGALFTTAPATLNLVQGASQSYAISGGVTTYAAVSSNPALVSALAAGSTLTITATPGTNGGNATVTLSDTAGSQIAVAVTVPAPVALFTTAPANLAIAVSPTATNFAIFGGTSPYAVTNLNSNIASGAITGGGTTLAVVGSAPGNTSIIVSDAKGASATIVVTVASPGPLFTSGQAAVTIAAGSSDTFSINGGVPAYSVSSSNTAVATATYLPGVSPGVRIDALAPGNATIQVTDSVNGSVNIAVTVPAPGVLFTSAPATLNIETAGAFAFNISGGYPAYTVASSKPNWVTASVTGSALSISAANGAALTNGGTATVTVKDSQNQSVSITVNVGTPKNLFTNAPVQACASASSGCVVVAVSSTYQYLVGGGTAFSDGSYSVSSSNPGVVTASFVGPVMTVVSGGGVGTGTIEVTDAIGAKLNIPFVVGTASSGGSSSPVYPSLTTVLKTTLGVTTSSIDATSYTLLKATLLDPSGVAIPNQVISVTGDPTKIIFPDGNAALTDGTGVATIKVARASLLATGAAAMTVTYDYKPGMIASYSFGAVPPSSASTITSYIGYQVTTANIALTCLNAGITGDPIVGGCYTSVSGLAAYGTRKLTVPVTINSIAATATPVTVTFAASCGQVIPATATTDSTGKVLVTYSATDAAGVPSTRGCSGTSVLLTATTSGATAVQQTLNVTAAPATSMSFVSASPTRIYLANSGGVTQSALTFQLVDAAGNGISGQSVKLSMRSLNGGLPKAAFDTGGSIADVTLTTDSLGKVAQPVYAGSVPTNVIVNASLVAIPTINIDSSVLAVASGRPVQSRLSLAVENGAIEGYNVDGTTTNVTLSMSDRNGNPVPDGTVVNFVTEGGVMIPPTCTTGTTPGDSRCAVTIRSQGTRPLNGLVTILAYTPGEEDFVDNDGDNLFTCGVDTYTDLGIAYRSDSMTSNGVIPAYVAGNFTVPRSGDSGTCGPAGITPTTGAGDGVWGAADVSKQAVIVFATSGAVISNVVVNSTSIGFTVADGNGNSMPTGTGIAVTVRDNTPDLSICAINSGGNQTVVNSLVPLATSASYVYCASGDLVNVTVTSPLGTVTSLSIAIP